jgi:cobyrinic acid a,c-diamide synthase
MRAPRLVIAGVASGVGKTTVMVALTQALRRRGLRVAVFKCGPDYLDPTYHARAAGVTCHNLDGWMMGREAVLATFTRASMDVDISLIEGVMGLYDGAAPDSEEGSAAEIAKWLNAPVVAVLDVSGMARTIAALGLGLRALDPALSIAGLFANRVGSRNHLDILKSACLHAGAPPVLGGLPEKAELAFPERHLGLRTAEREAIPDAQLAAWGALVDEWCAPEAFLRLAAEAPPLADLAPERIDGHLSTSPPRCRIGLARDAAFHFYYDDNLRRLESLGAELVPFSPLAATALPDVDGLYFGGGYPEVHAEALGANTTMRAAVRAFAGPIYAECGGLMYLADAIRALDGRTHEMVGLVRGTAVMQPKLQALGYVEVETQRRSILGGAGLRFRGHQFRYSTLEGAATDELAYSVRKRRGGTTTPEGYSATPNVLASYVHAHWASNPLVAEGFVASCAARRRA